MADPAALFGLLGIALGLFVIPFVIQHGLPRHRNAAIAAIVFLSVFVVCSAALFVSAGIAILHGNT
jgi:hypothetical protein